MTMANDKVRGLVIARWEQQGKPAWSVAKTVDVVAAVDQELEGRGLNPAARFREARMNKDRYSMRVWTLGCRFPWLRAREPEQDEGSAGATSTANRRLTPAELMRANSLLDLVRSRIDELAGVDQRLVFAYKRKIAKELQYDERGKPILRIRLKARKRKVQDGTCANDRVPPHKLPEKGAILDRFRAEDGYTDANTRLLCPSCDAQLQAEKGYSDPSP